MITDIHYPYKIAGYLLDDYLSQGWYRMAQIIFTTEYILYEEQEYNVYWLRYASEEIQFNRQHLKLLSLNKRFSVTIKPMDQISDEVEDLYHLYRSSIQFDAPNSATEVLFDGSPTNIYNSRIVEVRDGDKLIAAGIFDVGEISIAGILNFYDPAYKNYSLGKFLMLQKAMFAKASNFQWYYTGYIMDGNKKFDYKLFIGTDIAEIYLPVNDGWVRYNKNWPVNFPD